VTQATPPRPKPSTLTDNNPRPVDASALLSVLRAAWQIGEHR
jgi:hypothetical protein